MQAKISIVFLFLTIFFVSYACKEKSSRVSVQESRRVEASIFRSQCVICHGAEAEGKQLEEKMVPSLREGDAKQRSDEQLYEQISNGGNGMPPFKHQLTEPQIRNMVHFIRVLQSENP